MSRRICVSGNTGSGKSYKVKQFVTPRLRVLVYDFYGEYNQFVCVRDPAILQKLVQSPRFQISYHPRNAIADLTYFCQLASWLVDATIVFEECGILIKKNCPASIMSVLANSEKSRLDVFLTAHRPVAFGKDVGQLASHFIAHSSSVYDDVLYLKDLTGLEINQIMKLKGHEAIFIDKAKQTYDVL